MGSLTIRQIDDSIKNRLRQRAAANGRSMEEEARIALAQHLAEPSGNAFDALRKGLTLFEDIDFPKVGGNMRPLPDLFDE